MFYSIQKPTRHLSTQWLEDDLIELVGNAPIIKVGNTWRVEHLPNISPAIFTAALANLASAAIYAVTAGNLPVVYQIDVSGSIAGRYALTYNGVIFREVQLPAKSGISIEFSRPLVFAVAAASFAVVNASGAVSDVSASILLSEYTP